MLVQVFVDEPAAAGEQSVRPPLALVDRDGVINARRPDHVKRWAEFVFLPGVLDAFALLARAGWRVVVASNQAVINRGLVTERELTELHRRMVEAIRDNGGKVAAVYACPHRPDEGCGCRKPAPGLLRAAAERYASPIERAVFIGDQPTDLDAARRAGCRFMLLRSNAPDTPGLTLPVGTGELVVPDLLTAARYLAGDARC